MNTMIKAIVVIIAICLIALFLISIKTISTTIKKRKQLKRYWDINIGMPEGNMLDIMGDGYNRSLLKNNRIKYEWRINASSHGSSYKGISTRTYSGVRKVTIYTNNGFVEEVKPHNVY